MGCCGQKPPSRESKLAKLLAESWARAIGASQRWLKRAGTTD